MSSPNPNKRKNLKTRKVSGRDGDEHETNSPGPARKKSPEVIMVPNTPSPVPAPTRSPVIIVPNTPSPPITRKPPSPASPLFKSPPKIKLPPAMRDQRHNRQIARPKQKFKGSNYADILPNVKWIHQLDFGTGTSASEKRIKSIRPEGINAQEVEDDITEWPSPPKIPSESDGEWSTPDSPKRPPIPKPQDPATRVLGRKGNANRYIRAPRTKKDKAKGEFDPDLPLPAWGLPLPLIPTAKNFKPIPPPPQANFTVPQAVQQSVTSTRTAPPSSQERRAMGERDATIARERAQSVANGLIPPSAAAQKAARFGDAASAMGRAINATSNVTRVPFAVAVAAAKAGRPATPPRPQPPSQQVPAARVLGGNQSSSEESGRIRNTLAPKPYATQAPPSSSSSSGSSWSSDPQIPSSRGSAAQVMEARASDEIMGDAHSFSNSTVSSKASRPKSSSPLAKTQVLRSPPTQQLVQGGGINGFSPISAHSSQYTMSPGIPAAEPNRTPVSPGGDTESDDPETFVKPKLGRATSGEVRAIVKAAQPPDFDAIYAQQRQDRREILQREENDRILAEPPSQPLFRAQSVGDSPRALILANAGHPSPARPNSPAPPPPRPNLLRVGAAPREPARAVLLGMSPPRAAQSPTATGILRNLSPDTQ